MDISLWKQIGSGEKEYISNTLGNISIKLTIPEELRADSDVTRTYKILRLHNGVVTAIDTVYDATKHTITFETDKFSTYTLVYSDAESASQTGDENNPILWISIMFICAMGIVLTRKNLFSKMNENIE